MSHYSTIRTVLVDRDKLVQSLADLGFAGKVKVHGEAQRLQGYRGDLRNQTAEVIIPRRYVGRSSNDIGFKAGADGVYSAIISNFDRRKYSDKWLGRLTQRYAYHLAVDQLRQQGFELIEEKQQRDQQIHLVLRRSA